MSVVRTQHYTQTVATLADAVETVVDIVRPVSTPAEPAYAENTDWVTEARVLDQYESGKVNIIPAAAIAAATVFVRKIEVMDSGTTPQSGLSGAMFPSGAPAASFPALVRTIWNANGGNTMAGNSAAFASMLGGATFATPQQPGITLGASEFVRFTFFQSTGAPIGPATIEAKYDLGLNPANLPSV